MALVEVVSDLDGQCAQVAEVANGLAFQDSMVVTWLPIPTWRSTGSEHMDPRAAGCRSCIGRSWMRPGTPTGRAASPEARHLPSLVSRSFPGR